jgi:hypothetical protein
MMGSENRCREANGLLHMVCCPRGEYQSMSLPLHFVNTDLIQPWEALNVLSQQAV